MKILAVFLFSVSLAFAGVETKIEIGGYTPPASIQGAPWGMLTNYAGLNDDPVLGVGIGYRGNGFKVDLYVYDALRADWADLSIEEKLLKEKESIGDIFKEMTDRGDYSDVKILDSEVITMNGHKFEHIEINFHDRRAGDLNSHYYLSSLNGKVFKVRISRALETPASVVTEAIKEIAQTIKR